MISMLCSLALSAQESPIHLKIINQLKQPVPFATVIITDPMDSTRKQEKLTDSLGVAAFMLKRNEQYHVSVSSVNYQPLEKGIRLNDQQAITLTLQEAAKTLGAVVVRSSRPLMRQEDDKTIVDPENLVPSSTSGYEVIEKTPGIFVDQDGNMYISSTTPAKIFINGREMKMSNADVATLLKSLPPNSISRIEILRTPSAKYDASGTGGIVNVVLRKGVKLGLTGSITTAWQQGEYANRFAGLNLSNSNGPLSSYINLNIGKRDNYEQIQTNRLLGADTTLSQDAYTSYPVYVPYLGYGIGYELSKKWNLSYDGRISYNKFNNHTNNRSIIHKTNTGQLLTDNLTKVDNDGNALVVNQDLSSTYKLDSLGSEWTNALTYTYSRNVTDQLFLTTFTEPLLPQQGGGGDAENSRNVWIMQSDISKKLPRRLTVEAGIKSSWLRYTNESNYYFLTGNSQVEDPARTTSFNYRENINALYLQGSKGFGKNFLLKLGTRLENTNMEGHQLAPFDTSFSIHRTDLFPYVYLSKKIMRIAGYDIRAYLVYRRTISRPVYDQLNPFPRFIDNYLTEIGNPGLRPQFTQNYEANVSVDETPLLAVGVNETKDIFTNVIYQSDSSASHAYRTYDNLGKNREVYLRGLGAIPPGGVYFFVVGGQYNHNFYQGLYENKPLSFKKGSWTFFTYHTLKLGKRSLFTLNGFVRLKGQLQFYELSSFGALNASINRRFLNEKLIVTLSANDIFNTYRNEFTIDQGSMHAWGSRRADTRRFGINLRYNFGIRKKDDGQNIFNMESPEKTN